MSVLHARLFHVHDAVQSFRLPPSNPPVISLDSDSEPLPGLRLLRDEVKRERDQLGRFDPDSPTPSTNAPYLVAVWNELVHAHQPIAIYRTFSPENGHNKARTAPTRPVKVDVVAENGARWVRVNTIKNARLMMEFREIDSYLTSDEDEDEPRPSLAQTQFDNSVLRMGRDLLAAAKANPVPLSSSLTTTIAPRITIRLTRLDPCLEDDPRIEKTIQCLRDMGIDVQLGERSYLHTTQFKQLEPTTNINLDLSALIALVSDISHSPLPRTVQEAHARFEPPQSYLDWKKDRLKSLTRQNQTIRSPSEVEDSEGDEDTWVNSGQHSRALSAQVIQEMNNGILQEIRERISAIEASPSVTFWTTSEARHRCLQIVSKIGGEKERQRADALLGSTQCSSRAPVPAPTHKHGTTRTGDDAQKKVTADAYWEHSRYPAGFLPLVPVHVYPSILAVTEDKLRGSRVTFFDALTRTCARISSHGDTPVLPTAKDVLEELPPVTQTSLPKLTVHTVMSMLAGASRGYTTLTTNRSSVKAVLKETRGGYEAEVDKAALWVLDPRSLSEGMRAE